MLEVTCALHCRHQKEGYCTHRSYVETYKACAHYAPTDAITTRRPSVQQDNTKSIFEGVYI